MATSGESRSRTSGGWEAHLERSTSEVRLARALIAGLGWLSPELAARVAIRLFRTVRRHSVPDREIAWSARGRRLRNETGGRSLGGLCWGEGPPILLLHGWEGRASQMGGVGMALAARGMRAVSLEAPGHGAEPPHISSLWQFAEAVRDMASEKGPFAGFVGHSFGIAGACFALLEGWIRVDQLGSRLVFISPAGDLNDFFDILFSLLRLRPEVALRFVQRMEMGLGGPWRRASRCATLAAEEVPLLIVHDEGDRDTPIVGAETVAAAWPQSRLHRTTGLGHRKILRDAAVQELVAGFLAESGGPSGL